MFENIKYSFSLYRKYAGEKKFYLTFITGFILGVAIFLEPVFISKSVEIIEEFYNTGFFDLEGTYIIFGLWILATICIGILHYYQRYYLVDVTCLNEEVGEFLAKGDKVFKMKYGDYLGEKPGKIYKNLDRGLSGLFNINFSLTQEYFRQIVGISAVLILMFSINWKLAIAASAMIPVVLYIGFYYIGKTVTLQKDLHKEWEQNYGILGNFITNLQVVKNFSLENKANKTLKSKMKTILDKQLLLSKRWAFSNIYNNIVTIISRILVLSVGIYLMYLGELKLSELILFTSLIGFIYFPISFIFQNMRQLQDSLTAIGTFREKFENMETEIDLENATEIEKIKGEIELKNVGFEYNKDRKIFENLNLKIKPGEKVALVGHTGSGKSTITNLLLRLWDVNSGEILLDGQNINSIKYSSLRKHIGIVSQDNSLFNGTILENLQMIKENASENEIKDALKKAKADFIFKLKDGLNSEIGERGLKLSGGEKQRIAIARVFLRNPEIFILDEATSALDNKTEIEIQESLEKLMEGKTSIIIAHRLSTIKHVDRIIMLDEGKIIEEGSYEELMKRNGKFADLANPDKLILN